MYLARLTFAANACQEFKVTIGAGIQGPTDTRIDVFCAVTGNVGELAHVVSRDYMI
jgi:predicted acyltransferase (DUF342 family)